ncbi:MAG: hypothetical protein AAF493_08075 [Pseudomonadota bacterium]
MKPATSRKLIGIDWSGARDAARHIWLAEGVEHNDRLLLQSLTRGDALTDVNAPEETLVALEAWLLTQPIESAVGFDFPFSLPASLLPRSGWPSFIERFERKFPDPAAFKAWCLQMADGRELKRITDRITKTPFCAYNLRMYRQTYWGLRLLARLRGKRRFRVLPLERNASQAMWLLETCPASVLKRLDQYRPYKGRSESLRRSRRSLLRWLEGEGLLAVERTALRRTMIDDPGGDALDATLAAIGVHTALRRPDFPRVDWRAEYRHEACVYA